MKKPAAERFSRFVKIGTEVVIGAAIIAVFCRGAAPLKNAASSDIVSGKPTVSANSVSSAAGTTQSEPNSDTASYLIDINTATSEELQTLSGIGEAKAAAIIAYREEHGAFNDISEIVNVSGIGEKIFENIRDRITVGEVSGLPTASDIPPDPDLININTAASEELQTLSGIGETKAAAIIAYREEHGAFNDISEIMNVSGIGEKIFESIRKNITV